MTIIRSQDKLQKEQEFALFQNNQFITRNQQIWPTDWTCLESTIYYLAITETSCKKTSQHTYKKKGR